MDEQELRELYRKMWHALINKDIAALKKLHAEEFVLVHMTGIRQPRTEYLRCVQDGELNYFAERAENIFVDVAGDSGTLIGQSRVEAAVFGGRKNIWSLQLKFAVERRAGKWLFVGAHASTY